MLLFCHIGWMEYYQGYQGGDTIIGGGDNEEKLENCNFYIHHGYALGYVQAQNGTIKLERIAGDNINDDNLSGVDVIWTAKHPDGGARVVIGWYRNATVYREYQKIENQSNEHKKNGVDKYIIETEENNAYLLPVEERTCIVPAYIKGAPGRSLVWYANINESNNPENTRQIREKVIDFIDSKEKGKNNKTANIKIQDKSKSEQDQERKAQIEKIAIKTCVEHYEKLGYTVKSVEKDNLGWDLEAKYDEMKLRIEVKGLSNQNFSIELTPNEYNTFSELATNYRLAVVLNTLSSPVLYICRYSHEIQNWVVNEEITKNLDIQTKTSAFIKSSGF